MKKNKVGIIQWGQAGVHFSYTDDAFGSLIDVSCTTYYNSDFFFKNVQDGDYKNEDFSGAVVIDSSKVAYNVFKSPILSLRLKPRQIDSFVKNIILEDAKLEDAKSLDRVGIDLYVEFWRNCGAKIGKIAEDGFTVIWEG